jgi:flagellar hook-basal body complex protein FliE
MNTTPVGPVSFIKLEKEPKATQGNPLAGVSFEEKLGQALDKVNALQIESSELNTELASGKLEYLHQAMVMAEKAGLAFDFTLQLRNKVLEAYQEIMRTQI